MPTYQYRCTACGHALEVTQSFTDEALTSCPECSGLLRKQFSAVGVVFKGSGFYRTDSRENRTKKSTSEKPKTPVTNSNKSSETTPNSKPAPATPASGASAA